MNQLRQQIASMEESLVEKRKELLEMQVIEKNKTRLLLGILGGMQQIDNAELGKLVKELKTTDFLRGISGIFPVKTEFPANVVNLRVGELVWLLRPEATVEPNDEEVITV